MTGEHAFMVWCIDTETMLSTYDYKKDELKSGCNANEV